MRIALCCLFLGLGSAFAQESPSPTPSSTPLSLPLFPRRVHPPKVELRFALPPLEGTISLGIF